MSKVDVVFSLITPGVPTANGNVFSEECLVEVCKQANQLGEIFVTDGYSDASLGTVSLTHVLGRASRFYMNNEGKVCCTVELLPGVDQNLIDYLNGINVGLGLDMFGIRDTEGHVDPTSIRIKSVSFRGPK